MNTQQPATNLPKGAQPMKNLTLSPKTNRRNAFTLIEILIVVVILGILAAVVVPQFTSAADDANDAAVRSQLQTLRGQIELYRAQQGSDPNLLGTGWDDLVDADYLMVDPKNPIAPSETAATILGAEGTAGTGWLWIPKDNGTLALFACDDEGNKFIE
jgi:prepilin-type N-terminal cleavage/methylation domain-containing protein